MFFLHFPDNEKQEAFHIFLTGFVQVYNAEVPFEKRIQVQIAQLQNRAYLVRRKDY